MKKLLLVSLALVASLNLAQAQDQVYWSEVSMVVEPGNQGLVAQAVNDFYSSIDFPENSSVTLNAWQAKTEWREGTHFLNFAGSVEGMSKLRDLRSGEAYDNYVRNLSSVAKIVSMDETEFKNMVNSIRKAELAIGRINYELTDRQLKGRNFSRSLYVVSQIEK